jgi:hypothetical protein
VAFEAKRIRHRPIAVTKVAVGGLVAAGAGKQSAQPQQPDIAQYPTLIARKVRAAVDRAPWASAMSPSAPRSSSASTKPAVPQPAYRSSPARNKSSNALRITGIASSWSPSLGLSRAK